MFRRFSNCFECLNFCFTIGPTDDCRSFRFCQARPALNLIRRYITCAFSLRHPEVTKEIHGSPRVHEQRNYFRNQLSRNLRHQHCSHQLQMSSHLKLKGLGITQMFAADLDLARELRGGFQLKTTSEIYL